MRVRTLGLAVAAASAILILAAPSVPAVTPALLAPPSASATPAPAARGPRIYELPFPGGMTFNVCQGNNHAGSTHTGVAAYAWDFCMPIGTPVLAARGGKVTAVRQDSNVHGWGAQFADDANYVVVDHGDGTSGLYMHLMLNGARVKVGDQVQTGQIIAYSGDTGWTSAPHLHFMVMQTDAHNHYSQSLPVLFTDVPTDGGLPLEDHTYTSGNATVDPKYLSPTGPPPFMPFWVETLRASTLWSGADAKAVQFGPAAPWQFFQVVAPQDGSRLQVVVAATGAPAFIPAADVGPSGPPPPASGPSTTPPSTAGDPTPGSASAPTAGAGGAASPPSPTSPAAVSSASPATSEPPAAGNTLVVAPGDTLYGLAKAHQTTVDQLLAANHLTDPTQLHVGQQLVLPGQAPTAAAAPSAPAAAAAPAGQVVVAAGDSLFGLAKAHQTTVDQLLALNKLTDPNQLQVGQVLKLA